MLYNFGNGFEGLWDDIWHPNVWMVTYPFVDSFIEIITINNQLH